MTVLQQQNLLQYLGYYEGRVDGISGPVTQAAVDSFRGDNGMPALGEEVDEVLVSAVFYGRFKNTAVPDVVPEEDFWSTVKYFGRHEFACKCGKYCDGFPVEPDALLLEQADAVRKHFGAPVYVSSGVRCGKHNANVGGASGSRHKTGKAMDFCVVGKSAGEVLRFVNTLPAIRYAYAIDGSYVHMDVE